MPEPTDDILVASFSDFRESALPFIKTAGLEPVRAEVRRRHTIRVTIAVIAAVLVVVGPVTAYAARGDHHKVPSPPAGSATAPVPSPSAPSLSPSTNGTGQLNTAPDVTTSAGKPLDCAHAPSGSGSGPLTPPDLCNATLDVADPAYRGVCWASPLKLTRNTGRLDSSILRAASADVDGDGQADVVALINCQPGDPANQAVFAFTRAAGGGVRTIGTVTGPFEPDAKRLGDRVTGATDLTVDSTGLVRVRVDNLYGSGGSAHVIEIFQWRGYRWNGHAFHQTTGSRAFLADTTATKLSTMVSKVTVDPVRNGKAREWFTVTIRNTGHTTASGVSVIALLEYPPTGACTEPAEVDLAKCTIGTLRPGASKTVTVAFSIPSAEAKNPTIYSDSLVQIRLGDQQYALITAFQLA